MRLNRFLAVAGLCTRRAGDELIRKGKIQVNGHTIHTLGVQINPQADKVTYQGRLLTPAALVYVLLNKPKHYLCTRKDPAERKTIFALVRKASQQRLFSVGRLDRSTTGLILLTNDGLLAQALSHPSKEIQKVYQASLDRPLAQHDAQELLEGVALADGVAKPDALELSAQDGRSLRVSLHMGRNRIIHRMFEHLGYKVKKLDRCLYATLEKKGLAQGKWRYLSPEEVEQLKHL